MKRISFIVLVSLSFILSSCNVKKEKGESVSRIQVEMSSSPAVTRLSDIVKSSLILLPTSDSLIIDEINRIHRSADYIYVSDVSSVYQFTHNGEFVKRLSKQGEGPDEYLNISDFFVDKEKNIWILSRTAKKLYQYSTENKLLKCINLDIWAQNMYPLADDILLYTGNESNLANMQLHLLDIATGTIKKSYKAIKEKQAEYLHVKGNNVFRKISDKECCFSQLFNDTIYQVTPDSMSVVYSFDWSGHNIPESFYDKAFSNIMEFFQEFHSNGQYAYGINFFSETDDEYWVSYYFQRQCFCSILSKTDEKQILFTDFLIDNLGDYPVNLMDVSAFVQNDGSIIIPVDAMDVKEHLEKKLIDTHEIPDDSNPYLLVLELNG